MQSILKKWQSFVAALIVVIACIGCSSVPSISNNPWQVINVPTKAKLLDIGFTNNSQHGYLVGGNATLLETNDGGVTWQPLKLELDDPRYRFNSVSFSGQEG
ncbi:MAG: YCF48-related protein, partial [Dolichospermum sp.]|nr:YCF48-related protein [Dolichospermum sp.]